MFSLYFKEGLKLSRESEVIGLVLELQGFENDLFAFFGLIIFISLCEYTIRNKNHSLHKSDT
jgi:hypothetical protein